MAKYHIRRDGTPGVCHAHHRCPLGGEHFDNIKDAQVHADKVNAERYGFLNQKTPDDLLRMYSFKEIPTSELALLSREDIGNLEMVFKEADYDDIAKVRRAVEDGKVIPSYTAYLEADELAHYHESRMRQFNEIIYDTRSEIMEIADKNTIIKDSDSYKGMVSYAYRTNAYGAVTVETVRTGDVYREAILNADKIPTSVKIKASEAAEQYQEHRNRAIGQKQKAIEARARIVEEYGPGYYNDGNGDPTVIAKNLEKIKRESRIRNYLNSAGLKDENAIPYDAKDLSGDVIRIDDRGRIANLYGVNRHGDVERIIDVQENMFGATLIGENGNTFDSGESRDADGRISSSWSARIYVDDSNIKNTKEGVWKIPSFSMKYTDF